MRDGDGHEDYMDQLRWDVPECAGQPSPGSGP